MPLTTAFRLSFFVTLALACACLAVAETFFLWWMSFFLMGTLVLLGVAYHWEGRWVLSSDAANRLGMVIAIAAAFWILYKLPRNEDDLLASGVPWPAGLLPHLGPLLMLLVLVKLFRPKRLSDYWVMQTIGLMMVTLGCVLAAEPLFGVLLVIYLAALLWSLALFYLVRQEAASRCEDPGMLSLFDALGPVPALGLPWPRLGLGRIASWTGLVVVLGLVLFLLAPRADNFQWEPKQLASAAKGIIKTGMESGMDLNRVGKIEVSDEPAFEVRALDAGGVNVELDPQTRWFVQTLDYYAQGRWTSWGQGAAPPSLTSGISPRPEPLALPDGDERPHPRNPPPGLTADEFYLHFKVRLSSSGGLVLAEPLTDYRLGLFPHLGENSIEASLFFHLVGTDSILCSQQGRRRLYQYGQVVRKSQDPNRAPVSAAFDAKYRHFLLSQTIPEAISSWVRELAGQLPELTAAERQVARFGRVPAALHAKLARALTNYLAASGDFGYSLELRRGQLNIDPLADFLLNVKEGHCERYAGGLTLMLRSLGIPARVVKGFRGVQPPERPGVYVIRQNQAHSWVQALAQEDGKDMWLTLDPTPSSERTNQPLLSWLGWLVTRWSDGDNFWRSYIMEYNADQQGHAFEALQKQLTPDEPGQLLLPCLGAGTLAAGGALAFFLLRRRARVKLGGTADDTVVLAALGLGFYLRFLEVVGRLLHVRPDPGQTPREFGIATGRLLRSRSLADDCVSAPQELVALLYRVRFGGQTLSAAELAGAQRMVSGLETALQPLVPAPNKG